MRVETALPKLPDVQGNEEEENSDQNPRFWEELNWQLVNVFAAYSQHPRLRQK